MRKTEFISGDSAAGADFRESVQAVAAGATAYLCDLFDTTPLAARMGLIVTLIEQLLPLGNELTCEYVRALADCLDLSGDTTLGEMRRLDLVKKLIAAQDLARATTEGKA